MSAQGTQSPPLEATSRVDPLGNVNIRGDKAQGIKDIDQRVGKQQNFCLVCPTETAFEPRSTSFVFLSDQFGEGKEQNITADTSTGGGQDILKVLFVCG